VAVPCLLRRGALPCHQMRRFGYDIRAQTTPLDNRRFGIGDFSGWQLCFNKSTARNDMYDMSVVWSK